MHLTNLPYTSRKEPPVSWFHTSSQGLRRLSRKKAITSAGDNGAINVWYGDDGLWHGVICRYQQHVAEVEAAVKITLRDWLEKALVTIA